MKWIVIFFLSLDAAVGLDKACLALLFWDCNGRVVYPLTTMTTVVLTEVAEAESIQWALQVIKRNYWW